MHESNARSISTVPKGERVKMTRFPPRYDANRTAPRLLVYPPREALGFIPKKNMYLFDI